MYEDPTKAMRRRLRELVDAHELPKKKIEVRTGATRQTVWAWLNSDKGSISEEYAQAVAALLAEYDDPQGSSSGPPLPHTPVLVDSHQNKEVKGNQFMGLGPEYAALLADILSLPDDYRAAIMSNVESLKKLAETRKTDQEKAALVQALRDLT